MLLQIAYWMSSYPLGEAVAFPSSQGQAYIPPPPEDVVKSRVQLRMTPPKGTPVQYIARELKAVVAESGV
jgi:solute carrier family 25 (mitochondrial carnitine/acylcarnitine transporter), member 20/29